MPILINMKKKPGVDQWEGEVYNAKDGKTYSSTIKPIGSDKLEIQGCVLGFPVRRGNLDPRCRPDSAEYREQCSKRAPKTPVSPKTTGTTNATLIKRRKCGSKAGGHRAPPDVGDICLIPDIARFAH